MVQNKTAWKHGAARAVKAIFAVLGALTIVFRFFRRRIFNAQDFEPRRGRCQSVHDGI